MNPWHAAAIWPEHSRWPATHVRRRGKGTLDAAQRLQRLPDRAFAIHSYWCSLDGVQNPPVPAFWEEDLADRVRLRRARSGRARKA